MKATYKGIEYNLETEEDVKLFQSITGQNVAVPAFKFVPTQPKVEQKHSRKTLKRGTAWSKEEESILLDKYEKLSVKKLSKLLGRTRRAIYTRHCLLTTNKNVVEIKEPRNDFEDKVMNYFNSGTRPKDIAKLMNVAIHKIYLAIRHLKRKKLLFKKKDSLYMIRKKSALPVKHLFEIRDKLDTASFDYVSHDMMPIAREMIKACAKNKGRISISDCVTYLKLSVGEAKAFMQDVFQQQNDLGYKVIIKNDVLMFR